MIADVRCHAPHWQSHFQQSPNPAPRGCWQGGFSMVDGRFLIVDVCPGRCRHALADTRAARSHGRLGKPSLPSSTGGTRSRRVVSVALANDAPCGRMCGVLAGIRARDTPPHRAPEPNDQGRDRCPNGPREECRHALAEVRAARSPDGWDSRPCPPGGEARGGRMDAACRTDDDFAIALTVSPTSRRSARRSRNRGIRCCGYLLDSNRDFVPERPRPAFHFPPVRGCTCCR